MSSITLQGPPSSRSSSSFGAELALDRRIPIFDLQITDATYSEAAHLLEGLLLRRDRARAAHFVNAHTLNHANGDTAYRQVLGRAEHLFGDGTGVRWAVRALHGVQLRANLNGTDLVPYFMRRAARRRPRVFLLGTREEVLRGAATAVEREFDGWSVAGLHHGFFGDAEDRRVLDLVNASQADLLLVAMGNPRQETWIDRHLERLDVPLARGVGALFDYWAGAERRAPLWMQRAGMEWVYRMLFQQGKLTRYLFGNPEFLWHVARAKWRFG